jgi:hypothetical protein
MTTTATRLIFLGLRYWLAEGIARIADLVRGDGCPDCRRLALELERARRNP